MGIDPVTATLVGTVGSSVVGGLSARKQRKTAEAAAARQEALIKEAGKQLPIKKASPTDFTQLEPNEFIFSPAVAAPELEVAQVTPELSTAIAQGQRDVATLIRPTIETQAKFGIDPKVQENLKRQFREIAAQRTEEGLAQVEAAGQTGALPGGTSLRAKERVLTDVATSEAENVFQLGLDAAFQKIEGAQNLLNLGKTEQANAQMIQAREDLRVAQENQIKTNLFNIEKANIADTNKLILAMKEIAMGTATDLAAITAGEAKDKSRIANELYGNIGKGFTDFTSSMGKSSFFNSLNDDMKVAYLQNQK